MKNQLLILLFFTSFIFAGCVTQVQPAPLAVFNEPVENLPQDPIEPTFDLYFTEELSIITLLDNYSIGDMFINISSAVLPVQGNTVCLKEGANEYQADIVTVTALGGGNYELEMDTPLDSNFTTSGGCSLRNKNIAVDGSTTPHIFTLSPIGTTSSWDLYTITYHMESVTAMDSGKFGGQPALIRGFYCVRQDGITKNLFNIKSNGDWFHNGFTYNDVDKAPSGVYGIYGELNYREEFGVAIRMSKDTNDSIYCVVSEDLTGNNDFHLKGLGHRVLD